MARAFEVECLVCADFFYTTQGTSSLYSTSVIFILDVGFATEYAARRRRQAATGAATRAQLHAYPGGGSLRGLPPSV